MTRNPRERTVLGMAAVEMAVLLPLFCLVALGAVDFALLFRRATIVLECAASGAAAGTALGPSATVAARNLTILAAVNDYANVAELDPVPSATWSSGTDSEGIPYVEVVATYTPDGSIGAIWSSGTTPIVRKIRMMTTP